NTGKKNTDVELSDSMEKFDLGDNTLFVSSETNSLASNSSKKNALNSSNKIAATTLMPINTVYRVLIYEKSGNNWSFYKHLDITSGKNNPANNSIALVLNKDYRWVAYSYGTSSIAD